MSELEINYYTCANTYKTWNNPLDLGYYLSLHPISNIPLEKDLSVPSKGN